MIPQGLDPISMEMLDRQIPLTKERWLSMAYPDGIPEEFGAELQAQIPEAVTDKRVQSLDPSDPYYRYLVPLLMTHRELTPEEAREHLEAVF